MDAVEVEPVTHTEETSGDVIQTGAQSEERADAGLMKRVLRNVKASVVW